MLKVTVHKAAEEVLGYNKEKAGKREYMRTDKRNEKLNKRWQ